MAGPEGHVSSIQRFVSDKIEQGIQEAKLGIPWMVTEIYDLRQRIEELEIELMLAENDIDRVGPKLTFKNRSNF